MPDKIMRMDIELMDDEPVIVFSGKGKNLCFPAKGIQSIFDDAMRKYNAFESQRGGKAGQWTFALMVEPQTWNTGITDVGKVAITIDRGLPTEQTFALTGEYAKQLAEQLAGDAELAKAAPKAN